MGPQCHRPAKLHRSYRGPVGRLLRPGANRLTVTFSSALTHAERLRDTMGPRCRSRTAPQCTRPGERHTFRLTAAAPAGTAFVPPVPRTADLLSS
jgi:hypothetical protein